MNNLDDAAIDFPNPQYCEFWSQIAQIRNCVCVPNEKRSFLKKNKKS